MRTKEALIILDPKALETLRQNLLTVAEDAAQAVDALDASPVGEVTLSQARELQRAALIMARDAAQLALRLARICG